MGVDSSTLIGRVYQRLPLADIAPKWGRGLLQLNPVVIERTLLTIFATAVIVTTRVKGSQIISYNSNKLFRRV